MRYRNWIAATCVVAGVSAFALASPISARSSQIATADNCRLHSWAKVGAGNGIRTRDFDLGKVALYH